MLSVLSSYIQSIPPVTVDGVYGQATRAAVLAFQRRYQLPETGTVGETTWDTLYDQYSGIETTTLRAAEQFPSGQNNPAVAAGNFRRSGSRQQNRNSAYSQTTVMTQFPGKDLVMGNQDSVRQEVVR